MNLIKIALLSVRGRTLARTRFTTFRGATTEVATSEKTGFKTRGTGRGKAKGRGEENEVRSGASRGRNR